MTAANPNLTGTPPAPAPAASVGRLARLRLTEPLRLYLYGMALVLVVGLNVAGWLVGQWPAFAAAAGLTVLGIVGAGEAARVSVYSPASAVAAVMRARDN